jgi:hypothetical protein
MTPRDPNAIRRQLEQTRERLTEATSVTTYDRLRRQIAYMRDLLQRMEATR